MTRKDELLAAFDDTRSHRWESLESVFKGLTDEEADHQDEAYRNDEPYPGDPPPGTVKWFVHHLTHCYHHYRNVILLRPEKPEDTEPPVIAEIGLMLAELEKQRAALRDTVAALSDQALDEKTFNGDSVAMFVRMSIRHDAWHAGQIAVARRLYRMRPI